jgi:hypothetical protein
MRFYEFKTNKPLTPQQARINALKQQKQRATQQLQAEKEKQKKQKALTAIQKNNAVLAKLNTST